MLKLSPKILFFFVAFVDFTNQSAVNGATLKCEFETQPPIGIKGVPIYFCKVISNGIFTGERVIIDSTEGEHKTEHTNANVNGLVINNIVSIKFFPLNLENIFGDLIAISIVNCNLQEIKQENLKVFSKLQYLDLGENKITTINANLFEFNPDLIGINLSYNKISHIDANVFDHLVNLTYLHLSDNKCKIDLGSAFNSTLEVEELKQRVNNGDCSSAGEGEERIVHFEFTIKTATIEAIEFKTFKVKFLPQSSVEFSSLIALQSTNTEFKSVSRKNFQHYKNLKYITMTFGKLQHICSNTFDDLSSLEYLYIDYNEIKYLHPNTFANLPALTLLDLHANSFENLSKLTILSLNYNKINFIDATQFANNLDLREIGLYENSLTFIHNETFDRLTRLNRIEISKNPCLPDDELKAIGSYTYIASDSIGDFKKLISRNCFSRKNRMESEIDERIRHFEDYLASGEYREACNGVGKRLMGNFVVLVGVLVVGNLFY